MTTTSFSSDPDANPLENVDEREYEYLSAPEEMTVLLKRLMAFFLAKFAIAMSEEIEF